MFIRTALVCVHSLDCLVGMPATTPGDLHGKLHEEKLKYLVAELHFAHKEVRLRTRHRTRAAGVKIGRAHV